MTQEVGTMADFDAKHIDEEILPFLSTEARPDVRSIAMQYFLGLTGSENGCQFIAANDRYLTAIIDLADDSTQPSIMKEALFALINLSTYSDIAVKITTLSSQKDFVLKQLRLVLKPDFEHADIVCSILTNLSRCKDCAHEIVTQIVANQESVGFDKIITAFCTVGYNKHATLHYLGSFLSNLTQIKETRQYVLDKKRCVIQRLLPFTDYKDSVIRRGGVAATLHNCCFETDYHEWLLGEDVDILPWLLLPLAGPEEIDEEDTEKLPLDLQYLEPTKQRESDPDIRKLLLDTLQQLCVLRKCREYIKEKNTYVILQKLHLWESDPAARVACESVVHLLIAEEPLAENLRDVAIPPDVEARLDKGYQQLVKDIEEETRQLSCTPGDNTESGEPEENPTART